MTDGIFILGIRHHGPGSARSVVAALDAIQPQVVLVEGPPDADELIPLAAHTGMHPPVALLVYRPDAPKRAVFFPFAAFSPEWQAIQWALSKGVAVRFMDLPQRHRLAIEAAKEQAESGEAEGSDVETVEDDSRLDPFAEIAKAAGYSDGELWWEQQFEKRHSGPDIFKAVLEMMTALRDGQPLSPHEAKREAWMRQTVREAQKEGHSRIALVCGAWHAPALATMPTAKADAEVLRGMPKVAVSSTWLPWTHRRLTFASGYGAGIHSPGYYEQLWTLTEPGDLAVRWMTRVARLFRAEDLESSTASIIEATRLAETMAAMRGGGVAGLAEFNDAAQAVFCFGDGVPMTLIRERLIVGDALGVVPEEAPQVPLQRDFLKETKRLRLPPEALDKNLDLDLRKPNDMERSRLLHRLRLLGVAWGKPMGARGKGTFREAWKLRWEPELEVALIENAPWGNTIEEAATRFTVDRSEKCQTLVELTSLLEVLLLAELPEAVGRVMRHLENQAALTSDVSHLMDALPPLAAVLRYGNVRQTDSSMVGHIVTGLVARICAGLSPACASLNDEAASEMKRRIDATQSALATLGDETLRASWAQTLERLANDDTLHGLLAGRCARVLLDDGRLDAEAAGIQLSRHLSRANSPLVAAAWIEGFLSGSGLMLVHQASLLNMLDGWLGSLSADHFTEILPLLRRTFATFTPPERRQIGTQAGRGAPAAHVGGPHGEDIDESRANRLLPTFATLLGQPPKV
jgi:hypothetical protein